MTASFSDGTIPLRRACWACRNLKRAILLLYAEKVQGLLVTELQAPNGMKRVWQVLKIDANPHVAKVTVQKGTCLNYVKRA